MCEELCSMSNSENMMKWIMFAFRSIQSAYRYDQAQKINGEYTDRQKDRHRHKEIDRVRERKRGDREVNRERGGRERERVFSNFPTIKSV